MGRLCRIEFIGELNGIEGEVKELPPDRRLARIVDRRAVSPPSRTDIERQVTPLQLRHIVLPRMS